MSRLPRPHIPLVIRVQVAERQVSEAGFANLLTIDEQDKNPLRERLADALDFLFGEKKRELHHRPALVNRRRKRNGDYDPPANSPDYLVYLADDDHDVETRIRGLHGQHSDLGLARKNKNIAKNRAKAKGASNLTRNGKSGGSLGASRGTLRSANRWPPKGSQKIQNRRRP